MKHDSQEMRDLLAFERIVDAHTSAVAHHERLRAAVSVLLTDGIDDAPCMARKRAELRMLETRKALMDAFAVKTKTQTAREPNGRRKGDEGMMWEKTGPRSYKASNGSGFSAHVDDRGDHFLVTPKGSVVSVEVAGNSLDGLKLAVTEMAIRRASHEAA